MKHLLRKHPKITTLLLSSLFTCSVHADNPSFQHELSASTLSSTSDFDEATWFASYRYFAVPVLTNNSPYALNSFFAQTSNVGAEYIKNNLNDEDTYNLDGTYVFDSKFFIGIDYQSFNDNSDDWYFNDDEVSYGAKVGYFFNESTEVSLFYRNRSGDNSYQNTDNLDPADYNMLVTESNYDLEAITYGINFQSFITLESFSGINLQANWQNTQQDSNYFTRFALGDSYPTPDISERANDTSNDITVNLITLAADFYINQSWSVGANYQWKDVDWRSTKTISSELSLASDIAINNRNDDYSKYGINTAYWWEITNNVNIQFSATQYFNNDVDDMDDLLLGLDVNARF